MHTAGAAASAYAKRRQGERRTSAEQEVLASPQCPSGLTPCVISTEQAGYEVSLSLFSRLRTDAETRFRSASIPLVKSVSFPVFGGPRDLADEVT